MKSVSDLIEGDYIAFGFNYNGKEPDEIIVDRITSVWSKGAAFIVHFLYGHKSLAEIIEKEKILAIGNENGAGKIKGWGGKYDILNQKAINEIIDRANNSKVI